MGLKSTQRKISVQTITVTFVGRCGLLGELRMLLWLVFSVGAMAVVPRGGDIRTASASSESSSSPGRDNSLGLEEEEEGGWVRTVNHLTELQGDNKLTTIHYLIFVDNYFIFSV